MTETDWDKRTLCSDGNCIGIIGDDGYCRECGKPEDPNDPARSEPGTSDAGEAAGLPDEPDDAGPDSEPVEPDAYWQDRQLCSDESCIGVIGAAGRCKECGQPVGNAG